MHGAIFFTLPTGRRPARTGRFYPFVWDPSEQRVVPDLRPVENSVWRARRGRPARGADRPLRGVAGR